MFLYQIPARAASVRVRVWRRLNGMGAVQVRQSAYVLPNRDQPREDFEWLKTELESLGGSVMLLTADTADRAGHDELVQLFRSARSRDVAVLSKRAARWQKRAGRDGAAAGVRPVDREARALLEAWRALTAITYFAVDGAGGLEQTMQQITQLTTAGRSRRPAVAPAPPPDVASYTARRWVTRPRPGVDRMSSAWLIRKFIDPGATFEFATEPVPGAVPFDMFGVEFGHQGEACSFEVIADRFGVADEAARWIGRMVHDIDLRDSRFNEPETAGLASMVEGLRLAHPGDAELLERGIATVEALAQAYADRRTGQGAARHGSEPTRVSRSARRRRRGRLRSR